MKEATQWRLIWFEKRMETLSSCYSLISVKLTYIVLKWLYISLVLLHVKAERTQFFSDFWWTTLLVAWRCPFQDGFIQSRGPAARGRCRCRGHFRGAQKNGLENAENGGVSHGRWGLFLGPPAHPKINTVTFFVLSGKLLSYQGFQIMISMGWGGSKFLRLTVLVGGFKYVFTFTLVWGRFPIWLIFFKGVETINQCKLMVILVCFLFLPLHNPRS